MSNDEYESIDAMLDSLPDATGYLYVLHAEGTSFIKIGYGQNVQQRLAELQPGCPHRLHILYAVPALDAPGLEKLMHDHFAAYRIHGEWFALPDAVPTVLQLLAFLYRQSSGPPVIPRFNVSTRGVSSSTIVEVLLAHGTLSIADIHEKVGLESVSYQNLRTSLHRLYVAGVIGKSARGIYHALPQTEENSA